MKTLQEFIEEAKKTKYDIYGMIDSYAGSDYSIRHEEFDKYLTDLITQACQLMAEETKLKKQGAPKKWPVDLDKRDLFLTAYANGWDSATSDQEEKTKRFLGL